MNVLHAWKGGIAVGSVYGCSQRSTKGVICCKLLGRAETWTKHNFRVVTTGLQDRVDRDEKQHSRSHSVCLVKQGVQQGGSGVAGAVHPKPRAPLPPRAVPQRRRPGGVQCKCGALLRRVARIARARGAGRRGVGPKSGRIWVQHARCLTIFQAARLQKCCLRPRRVLTEWMRCAGADWSGWCSRMLPWAFLLFFCLLFVRGCAIARAKELQNEPGMQERGGGASAKGSPRLFVAQKVKAAPATSKSIRCVYKTSRAHQERVVHESVFDAWPL